MLPEERARIKIDKQLNEAGWDIVTRNEYVQKSAAASVRRLHASLPYGKKHFSPRKERMAKSNSWQLPQYTGPYESIPAKGSREYTDISFLIAE